MRKVGKLQILHKRTTSTTPFLVCAYLLGFLIAFRINIAYSTKFSFIKEFPFCLTQFSLVRVCKLNITTQ